MQEKELYKKIARLQSKLDVLETEIVYLNRILKKCGFQRGVETLKICALELLEEKNAAQ